MVDQEERMPARSTLDDRRSAESAGGCRVSVAGVETFIGTVPCTLFVRAAKRSSDVTSDSSTRRGGRFLQRVSHQGRIGNERTFALVRPPLVEKP